MTQIKLELASLQAAGVFKSLAGILRGLEKESLRINPDGSLAQTPHQQSLGSALTHPEITTDFSESLLEFITKPHQDVNALLTQLDNIHRYTYQCLDNELLWVNSMPCALPNDDEIPLAQYGTSNVAQMKTIYRMGLGQRYGRKMQTIAGVHYNFSLPDEFWQQLHSLENNSESLQSFKTRRYFSLIRNFRRYFWLLLYLFGAAPAVCSSFVKDRQHQLEPFEADLHTLYSPFATSLRMGDLGYQSTAQQSLLVYYNNLRDYLTTLCGAITRPHPSYQAIGIQDKDGHYLQLNDGVLQIENEFYSTIRPKRTAGRGETALRALHDRGVEYIEVRCIDLNPFEPIGISEEQIYFYDAFLIFCALADSPEANQAESRNVLENQQRIVYQGRNPTLMLLDHDKPRPFHEWADKLMEEIATAAGLLDDAYSTGQYSEVVAKQYAKLQDSNLTPSAQFLAELGESGLSFYQYSLSLARKHDQYFRDRPLSEEDFSRYQAMAKDSLATQKAIETEQQNEHFKVYRDRFYKQYAYCQNSEGCV